jgi:homoserine kinase
MLRLFGAALAGAVRAGYNRREWGHCEIVTNRTPDRVRVRVPATSANLGPGFDALGLALNIYNYVEIGAGEERDRVTCSGTHAIELPQDETNIALGAVRRLLRQLDAPQTPLHLHLENHIPFARGLGSSAAARAGALVAAKAWARQNGWGDARAVKLLAVATQLEGHPDNAAAALLGGLVVSSALEADAAQVVAQRVPVPRFPRLLVFVPDYELPTSEARRVLPLNVSRLDATFNVARSSLLVAALAAECWELLPHALQDRLHQQARAALLPGFEAIAGAAREAGAYGATLSGAGPTILLWLPDDDAIIAQTRHAIAEIAAAQSVSGEAREVEVDAEGCVVVDAGAAA